MAQFRKCVSGDKRYVVALEDGSSTELFDEHGNPLTESVPIERDNWQNPGYRFEPHQFGPSHFGVFDTWTGNFVLESGGLFEVAFYDQAGTYARALNAIHEKLSSVKFDAPEPIRKHTH